MASILLYPSYHLPKDHLFILKKGFLILLRTFVSSQPKLLIMYTPTGFENLFKEVGVPVPHISSFTPPPPRSTPTEIEELKKIANEYAVEIVASPSSLSS
jgi:hypothetical protein